MARAGVGEARRVREGFSWIEWCSVRSQACAIVVAPHHRRREGTFAPGSSSRPTSRSILSRQILSQSA
jgi:hypothetical protein